MKNCLSLIVVLLLQVGCSPTGIDDPSKRNENWAWFVDKSSGQGYWIPTKGPTNSFTGQYTLFYPTGEILEIANIVDTFNVDTARIFDKSGKCLRYRIYSANNKYTTYYVKDGKYSENWTTGELWLVGTVKNHKQDGLWRSYYKNGNLCWQENNTNGAGWSSFFYESGKMKDSTYLINGVLNGVSKWWYENGQLQDITNWKDGVEDGEQLRYYDNGQLKEKLTWIRGIKEGVAVEYYSNGNLKFEYGYLNGLEHGSVRRFHENGKLYAKGYVEKEKQVGEWLWYDDTGKLFQKDFYKNGALIEVKKY